MDLSDFHAVRTFLVQAFGQRFTEVVDAGTIAKLITEDLSEDVGTTVKVDGEASDAYGYATLVPFGHPADQKAISMLKALLLKTCSSEQQTRLKADLERKGTSLVFMDRFVNLPADLASPLFKQLLDDVKNAVKEDPVFKTERVFISTPVYMEVQSDLKVEVEHESKKSKKGLKNKIDSASSAPKYYYEECELLDGLCDYHWTYKVDPENRVSDSKRAFGDLGIECSRRIFCLPWDQFCRFAASIEKYVSE